MANTTQPGKGAAGHGAPGSHGAQDKSTMDKAKDVASSVADKAKDAASAVADKARDFASAAGDRADDLTAKVGHGMESLGGAIRENMPSSGTMGAVADRAAGGFESAGRYLAEEGLGGMADDLTNLIRRNPVPALLVGIGLGFLLARATRS